jgi:hypothetical protein
MSLNKINFDCTRVYDNKTNKTNYVCNPSRNIENFQTLTTSPGVTAAATAAATPAATPPPTFPQKQMVCINNLPVAVNITSKPLPVATLPPNFSCNAVTLAVTSIRYNAENGSNVVPGTIDGTGGIAYWDVPYNTKFKVSVTGPSISGPISWLCNWGGHVNPPTLSTSVNISGTPLECEFYSPVSANGYNNAVSKITFTFNNCTNIILFTFTSNLAR